MSAARARARAGWGAGAQLLPRPWCRGASVPLNPGLKTEHPACNGVAVRAAVSTRLRSLHLLGTLLVAVAAEGAGVACAQCPALTRLHVAPPRRAVCSSCSPWWTTTGPSWCRRGWTPSRASGGRGAAARAASPRAWRSGGSCTTRCSRVGGWGVGGAGGVACMGALASNAVLARQRR